MNQISKLGYAKNSPFRNSPYLDIKTPQGLITMKNTPHDIVGITPDGEMQYMKANSKNPYKFNSSVVREIPMQVGGLFDTNKTAYVDSVLGANKNLDWVKRLYDKNPKSIQIVGQPYPSTHFMSDDGKGYVFPSVVNDNNTLRYLGESAEDYARKTKTGIQFPATQGSWFAANGYKQGTGVLKTFQNGGLMEEHLGGGFHGNISKAMAKNILKDGEVNGVKLSAHQKHYFKHLAKGEVGFKNDKAYMKQMGGYNAKMIYDYLFEGDDEEDNLPTAPSTEEVQEPEQDDFAAHEKQAQDEQDYQTSMAIAMRESAQGRNPYGMRKAASLHDAMKMSVNPYLQKASDELFSQFNISNLGIWGDEAHQRRQSDHNTGDAQDFGFDNTNTANSVVNKLQSEAQDKNIKYIIYNGKIWNPSVSNDWRPYNGPNKHTDHIHVSYNR